jgi:uncharacterized protein YndB with AHSA1/START domain
MTHTDIGVVEQTLRIEARPETVWRYWTDPERLNEWWGPATELDARPGGEYVIGSGAGGPTMRGEFVEVVPHERIVFTFGWDPMEGSGPLIPPKSTRVEVTLTPADGDTILTLRHSGLPVVYAEDHRAGWAQHLPLLADAIKRQPKEA